MGPVQRRSCRNERGVCISTSSGVLTTTDHHSYNRYEAEVYDIILQYSTHPTEHLEEIEVFIGNVICRAGYRSKRQKEYTTGMKEKYDREVLSLIANIRDDQVTEEPYEALRRSMVCLFIGIQEPGERKEKVEGCRRDTFGWIAAAACLKELEKYQEDRDVGPLKKGLGMMKIRPRP